MNNIWKIFITDLKGLIKNPLAFIIAVGLCVLPSLYAWFNVYSNWNPYGNTSNIQIAIISEDEGYTEDDGTYVNMGDEVVEEMEAKTTITWTVVDTAEEATDGVYSGKYYAAVVISKDFTKSMYHALETDFDANPTITYYENEKKNAIATKITDSAVSSLTQSTNEKFIEVVTSAIFEKTNILAEDIKQDDSMATLEAKLQQLNTNLTSYSNLVTTFMESNESLTKAVDDASDEMPAISSSIKNGANSISKANMDLQNTQASLENFKQNITNTLSTINNSLNAVATDIENAGIAEDAVATAKSAQQAASDTAELIKQLNALKQTLQDTANGSQDQQEAEDAIQSVIDTIDSLLNGADDIQGQLDDLLGNSGIELPDVNVDVDKDQIQSEVEKLVGDSVNTATDSIKNSLNNCSKSIENMKSLYTNSLVPEMNTMVDSMSKVLNNVTNVLNGLSTTVGDMTNIFDGIETTISGTNDSLEQIKEVIDNVNAKIEELLNKLQNAEEDEKVQVILDVMEGDPESYGEFFSAPVTMTTEPVYPIANYGSAMTPFYSVLAIWVGMTILVSILKVKAEPKGLTNVKSYQLFFGRYLLFLLLNEVQAVIIVLGDIYILHCQVMYPGLFFLAAALTSLTFSLLIYALTLSFGDIGKALAVVVMVIQIAGSSGTFPIELLPTVYQKIYIFFPFPYAINAIRETIGGMYADTYVKSLSELLIFAVGALIVGLVIRIPFVGINHYMEERMEDTKMM